MDVGVGRQLVTLLRPWWRRLALVVVAILAASLMELVPPLIVRHIVDRNLTVGRTGGLVAAALLYLAAVACAQLFTFTYAYQATVIAQKAIHALRVRVFTHLCRLPVSYHDHNATGDSVSRCTADLDAVGQLFTRGLATLVGQLVALVFVAAAMVLLSPALSLVAAVALPPLLALSRYMRRKVRDAQRANRAALGRLAARTEETVAGMEVVRSFGREEVFVERFRRLARDVLGSFCRANVSNTFYAPVVGILAAAGTAALLGSAAGGLFGLDAIPLGTLTAFVLLFQRFFEPITALGEQWQRVQEALSAAERVFQVLTLPLDQPAPALSGDADSDLPNARIQVRDLTFGYGDGAPVLAGVSFDVRPGEHVVLVGPTAAGKSTLVHLLGGLYAPWSGSVRVGGLDPRSLSDRQRAEVLAVVPQQTHLLSASVRANVELGSGDGALDAAAFDRAIDLTRLGPVLEDLAGGLEAPVAGAGGGPGLTLSAGQRQLVGLARALRADPPVLVLDEATAFVDAATDLAIRQGVRKWSDQGGRAVLMVAHRLSSARDADRVIVLKHGCVVEDGAPDRLAEEGGYFAEMLALEAAGWCWDDDTAGGRRAAD